ncbi:MAG: hypothetical protein V4750_17540 [Pseudomonadota bacterium]
MALMHAMLAVMVVPVAEVLLMLLRLVMARTMFPRADRRRGPVRERGGSERREQGGDEERFDGGHVKRPVSIGFDVAPNPLSGPGMCRACDHNGRRVGGVDQATRKELRRRLTSNAMVRPRRLQRTV